jgi:hypothetical protein
MSFALAVDRVIVHEEVILNGTVVTNHSGMLEPLAAAYHRHAIETFTVQLDKRDPKMSKALDTTPTACTEVEPANKAGRSTSSRASTHRAIFKATIATMKGLFFGIIAEKAGANAMGCCAPDIAVRVQYGRLALLADEGSHMLGSLLIADALAWLQATRQLFAAGDLVSVHWFHR